MLTAIVTSIIGLVYVFVGTFHTANVAFTVSIMVVRALHSADSTYAVFVVIMRALYTAGVAFTVSISTVSTLNSANGTHTVRVTFVRALYSADSAYTVLVIMRALYTAGVAFTVCITTVGTFHAANGTFAVSVTAVGANFAAVIAYAFCPTMIFAIDYLYFFTWFHIGKFYKRTVRSQSVRLAFCKNRSILIAVCIVNQTRKRTYRSAAKFRFRL